MIFVLLILFVVFSLSTFKEQAAEGYGGGQNLANKVLSKGVKDAILVTVDASQSTDQQLKAGFEESLKGKAINLKFISATSPSDAKKALQKLSSEVSAGTLILCSKQAGNWEIYSKVEHFKQSEIIIPQVETSSSFLSSANLSTLPRKTAKLAIIAIGMTMVIITAGIDLSVGSLVALSSVVSAMTLTMFGTEISPVSITIAFAAGIGICGAFGFASGLLSTAFKIPAFIVTLAVMLIASGWAQEMSGNQVIEAKVPVWLGQGGVSVTLMIILYIIAYIVMHKTVLGRQIYAIGGNEEAARLSGVPVNKVLIIVYTITGILAGISGILMTAEYSAGKDTFGAGWELNVIAAVVVGGTSLMGGQGKIIGTLIGCVIIEVINNGMNLMGIGSNSQKIVMGIVILLAIIIDKFKKGEINWFSNIKRKIKSNGKGDIQCLSESTVKAS